MSWSAQEKAYCVLVFAKTGSGTIVQRQFRRHYGLSWRASVPSIANFARWTEDLLDRGSCEAKKRNRSRFATNQEKIEAVLETIRNDPNLSVRAIANLDDMPSKSSVHRILKSQKFHPYKLQLIQEIAGEAPQARIEHAISILDQIEAQPEFLSNLIFSDEAHFHIHGHVNHHNFRYWCDENPSWFREEPLHSPRLTVWAGISKRGVVGPFFTRQNVTGLSYLNLLRDQMMPVLLTWPHYHELVFMQDGAPPHFAVAVRQWLDDVFPLRWMGRGSQSSPAPLRWPPYSPDLTPCDFFLWGYVKSQVYRTQPSNLDELQRRIEEVFVNISQETINNAVDNYQDRLEKVIEVNGKSVEISA